MKNISFILVIFQLLFLHFAGNDSLLADKNKKGNIKSIPKKAEKKETGSGITGLNRKIIKYVNSVMGKKVKRGQCWDLAAVPLIRYGAKWNGYYKFGKSLNPGRDRIMPGDIIQFYSVKIVSKRPRSSMSYMTLGYPRHTAIIYKVLSRKRYQIAHQNFSKRRYVMLHIIDLNDLTRGRYEIFRPVLAEAKKKALLSADAKTP